MLSLSCCLEDVTFVLTFWAFTSLLLTNVLTAGPIGVSIRNIVSLMTGLWVHVHMCPIAVFLVDHS